jgi:hypothetical protein
MRKTLPASIAAAFAALLLLAACGATPEGFARKADPASAADAGAARFHAEFYEAAFPYKSGETGGEPGAPIDFTKGAALRYERGDLLALDMGRVREVMRLLDPDSAGHRTVFEDRALSHVEIISLPPEKCGAAIAVLTEAKNEAAGPAAVRFLYQKGASGDCSAEIRKLKNLANYEAARHTVFYFGSPDAPDLPFCSAVPRSRKTLLHRATPDNRSFVPPWMGYGRGYCFSDNFEVYQYFWKTARSVR